MRATLAQLARELLHRSPVRDWAFPRFPYNVTVPQLVYLCEAAERTRGVPGCVVEVGCFRGDTTLFLATYLRQQGIARRYVAIDTFSGFTERDVTHEADSRGKDRSRYGSFRANKREWFDATMARNGLSSVVRSVQADAATFDYGSLGPIALAFLDVDLYLPVKAALPGVHGALAPGGVLLVHDCADGENIFDGAAQAFREFCRERGVPATVVRGALGVIERPA